MVHLNEPFIVKLLSFHESLCLSMNNNCKKKKGTLGECFHSPLTPLTLSPTPLGQGAPDPAQPEEAVCPGPGYQSEEEC